MIRAVLFDLDGTLVNTEPLHFAAFNEVLAPLGIRIDRQDYFTRLIGYDDRGCFETVLRENGVEPEPENIAELIKNKSDHYLDMVGRSTDLLYPRAAEIVAACGERFPLMLVTGTLRKEAELILKGCGLRNKFVDVIAADDVERGKPHPDGFNTALGRLGFQLRVRPPITAEECLVIEDTPAGIEAAHAAGMPVVAVAQTTSAANLAKADIVTESIAAIDLDSLLRQLSLRGD